MLELLREQPFFAGMSQADLELLSGCARHQVFQENTLLARENTPADNFYLLRHGRAAIETPLPNRQPLRLQTLDEGDIAGWSWLFPPYRWNFDIRALSELQVIALDGNCLRGKCAADPRFGFDLLQRFSRIMTARLQAARLQLMDIYGSSQGTPL